MNWLDCSVFLAHCLPCGPYILFLHGGNLKSFPLEPSLRHLAYLQKRACQALPPEGC